MCIPVCAVNSSKATIYQQGVFFKSMITFTFVHSAKEDTSFVYGRLVQQLQCSVQPVSNSGLDGRETCPCLNRIAFSNVHISDVESEEFDESVNA